MLFQGHLKRPERQFCGHGGVHRPPHDAPGIQIYRDRQVQPAFFGRNMMMSLDRTTWEHGESPLNLLVLGAVVHGYTIPPV